MTPPVKAASHPWRYTCKLSIVSAKIAETGRNGAFQII